MSTRLRIAAAAALVLSALAIGLATSSAAQAGPRENIATARLCLRGGWHSLQTADGRSFRNLGRCVVYALFGGQFGTPDPGGSGEGTPGGTGGTGGTDSGE